MVHQNTPHRLRRDAEEVGPILPFHRPLIDELDERLVDERRWLQGVVRALLSQVAGRQLPQLPIDLRNQAVERLLLAIAPLLKQAGNLGRRTFHPVRINLPRDQPPPRLRRSAGASAKAEADWPRRGLPPPMSEKPGGFRVNQQTRKSGEWHGLADCWARGDDFHPNFQ